MNVNASMTSSKVGFDLNENSYTRVPITSRRASYWVLFILVLSILLPPLPFGNRLESGEIITYLSTVIFYLKYRPIIDRKHIYVAGLIFLFFFIQIFSVLLSSLNEYKGFVYDRGDLADFRRFLQLSLSFLLFNVLISIVARDNSALVRLVKNSLIILVIPAIISTFQFLDVFGFKEIVTDIYKTVFMMESREQRLDYRVASVFQDPYTAGIYLSWFILFVFFCMIKIKKISKISFVCVCMISYMAMFYTLRTGILIVPAGICLLIFFASIMDRSRVVRFLPYFLTSISGAGFLIFFFILSDPIKFAWAIEAFNIIGGRAQEIQSLFQTNLGNAITMDFIYKNSWVLFIPMHPDITGDNFRSGENLGLFLDSFYFNGVIRYGIYIIIYYFFIMIFLLRKGIKSNNYFIVVLAILSIIISWKGGNGFLLTKVVTPLGFMVAVSIFVSKMFDGKKDIF